MFGEKAEKYLLKKAKKALKDKPMYINQSSKIKRILEQSYIMGYARGTVNTMDIFIESKGGISS
jgi:hypothetical protein